ncbi:MAG: FtsH protease activity modulator HflK [Alphaproteobacteria bacterium]|nr:FtsH protease activity modulator HflK [Alphaproteobacteria bacterium]
MGRDDRKNPWGSNGGSNKGGNGDNPWGSNRGNKGGKKDSGNDPDIDEMLRRAQDNFKGMLPENFQGAPLIGLIIIVLAALWLASGFYVVNPGENAVVQRFGKWQRTQAEPGLGYALPAPIETKTVIKVQEIKRMNIGFVDGLTRGGGNARRDLPEESLMLTSDRNIVDLDVVIQWNIKSAEEYLFNILDQENTIKKVAESAIREVVGQTDMFPIITTGRAAIAEAIQKIIQNNLDEYKSGVNITQVLIDRADVHPDVQAAFQDVQSAKQDAEDIQNRANAYREDILPRARGAAIKNIQEATGYKESTVAKATGDADRFNSVYKAYQTGKDVTRERIFIETMEDVLKNANKIIMDSGNSQGVVPYLPLNQLNSNTNNQSK